MGNSIKDVALVQSIQVDINLVDNNDGQIPGVKRNPREMTEAEFKKLKKAEQKRLHHVIAWNNAVPKIVREIHKKQHKSNDLTAQ